MEINPIIIGILAGCLTAVAMIPQLVKIITQKKAEQISLGMVIILITGLSCWVWYGILINDYPVIITNAFSILVNLLIIIFSLKYKKK
ncbi:SemiSWEET transporter [Terrimonas rubra]|uniref:SemiSWEET transporter n=1 Tax=Terrimonas rubra TaxID=1035890 RepID=A0ABW6A8V3_9BACT